MDSPESVSITATVCMSPSWGSVVVGLAVVVNPCGVGPIGPL